MEEMTRRKFGKCAALAVFATRCIAMPELIRAAVIDDADPTRPTAISKSPIQLNLDHIAATSGFIIAPGDTTVQGNGWNSGIAVTAGANNTALYNGIPFQPAAGKPPAQAADLLLRDFKVVGNRGDGKNGNSTSGNPRTADSSGSWIFGIHLANVTRVLVDHVWVYDAPTYALLFDNVSNAIIQNSRFESPSGALNTDGIHINGPASDIGIHNCDILSAGDDSIALNAPEGYAGDINRVTISDCRFHGCLTAMRIYTFVSEPPCRVKDVLFNNCTGKIADRNGVPCAVFRLGNTPRSNQLDLISSLSISNCIFTTERYFLQAVDNIGILKLSNVTWDSPTSAGYGFICLELSTISELVVTGCSIYRSSAGSAPAGLINSRDPAGALVEKLVINGFSIDNEAGTSPNAVPYLIDMQNLTIHHLVIESLDPTNVAALVNPTAGFTGIGSISGSGVLATGFQIPDSIMANGVPYISATGPNAGKPCIRIDGKIMAYAST
ncbi:MAG: right-handed parallel beta-helix repeat-containing protein [Acidobacteriaceae bacterium]